MLNVRPPEAVYNFLANEILVPRETILKFSLYISCLLRWQQKINLIGKASEEEIWKRHALDSAQLHLLLPDKKEPIADIGSGAGFPGLVLAMLGHPVTLIEQDRRKAEFLREAARQTGTEVTILAKAVKDVMLEVPILTARALAPLPQLLEMSAHLMRADSICLFQKGKNYSMELVSAKTSWEFSHHIIPSRTDPHGVILKLEEIKRR